MHLYPAQRLDVHAFISDIVDSLQHSDPIVARRRLETHTQRIIDGHEDVSARALLLHTAIESSDESIRRRLEGLAGLEEVKRISESHGSAENNTSIAGAAKGRKRLVAFTSVMKLLGPAVLAHHRWVPPAEEGGSGLRFFEELLTSVKKSDSNKVTWTRRLNRAVYDRVWKHGERKLAAAIAPKQKTVGTPESLVQQCDLEQVKAWADSLNWPNNDQPLTSEEIDKTGCTLDEFGILAAKTECVDSPRPGPTAKQNHAVDIRGTKRSFAASHSLGANTGIDALCGKRHQAQTVRKNSSLRHERRRPQPQLPTPERELALTPAQDEALDTASESQEHDEVSTQHSEGGDNVDETRDKQRAETDERRLQQQPTLPPLADAAALESDFESAKDNIQAHLTRLQSYLDSEHHSHIDVAKKWLTNAKRPRYSLIDQHFDPSATADCDVYKVSAGENEEGQRRFLDLLQIESQPMVLDRPVHITGEKFRPDTTAEELASQLVELSAPVESQGYGGKNQKIDARALLDVIQRENTIAVSSGENESLRVPLNLLNLTPTECLQTPEFLFARHSNHQRFHLLHHLTRYHRLRGKVARSSDLANNVGFQLIATSLAFSGAHVNILGGSWIRVIDGEQLWLFASKESSKDADFRQFVEDGASWVPRHACLVTLKKGDIFYMPAGTRIIHAPLTLRPCHIRGESVWDFRSIIPTLENLAWTCKNSATVTNEDVPLQIADIIDALRAIAGQDEYKLFANACGMDASDFSTRFYSAIKEIKSIGCLCGTCRKSCPCKENRRRCTGFCGHHKKPCNEALNS